MANIVNYGAVAFRLVWEYVADIAVNDASPYYKMSQVMYGPASRGVLKPTRLTMFEI